MRPILQLFAPLLIVLVAFAQITPMVSWNSGVSGCPTGPPNGSTFWYKADAGVTCSGGCSNGASVTSWADQSGNGHTATTASGTLIYNTNQLNGLPAIKATSAAYASISGMNNGDDCHTLFVVFNLAGTTTGGFVGGNGIWTVYATGNAGFGFDAASSVFGGSGAGTNTVGTWFQMNIINSGVASAPNCFGNSLQFRRARANITSTLSCSTCNINSPNQLFTYNGATDPLIGSMAEVIYYQSLLNGTNIAAGENYLNCKYGV